MKFWIICAALVLGFLGLSLSGINEYVFFAGFVILQFVVLATAWNILGGYAGYVNFGVPAFVAVGAYTAVVLFKAFQAPVLVQIIGGGLLAGLLGQGQLMAAQQQGGDADRAADRAAHGPDDPPARWQGGSLTERHGAP